MSSSTHGGGSEYAYERLRAAIVEHRYEPGQRLIEQRVAEELEVSRTPIREALRRLEAEGFVTTSPNRGAAVRDVSIDEIVDLYELRARLESYAAELAAQRMSGAEVDRLAIAVEYYSTETAAVADRSDPDAVRRLNDTNSAVHEAIAAGSGHRRLQAMLHRAVDIPLVFGALRDFSLSDRQRSDLFHHLILEAIVNHDGVRAARIMGEHIAQGRDAVVGSHLVRTAPRDPGGSTVKRIS